VLESVRKSFIGIRDIVSKSRVDTLYGLKPAGKYRQDVSYHLNKTYYLTNL